MRFRLSDSDRAELNRVIADLQAKVDAKKDMVQNIILIRLFGRILEDEILPWQKTFHSNCISYTTNKEYRGINRFLLDDGEYITWKALKEYNEKHKTNYRQMKPSENDDFLTRRKKGTYLVVFFKRTERKLSVSEMNVIRGGGTVSGAVETSVGSGVYVKQSFILRYTHVINTDSLVDVDTGKQFPKRMHQTVEERSLSGDEIIKKYCDKYGVQMKTADSCYYSEADDSVYMVSMSNHTSPEEWYRNAFHELGHSTGIASRLNRKCFAEYSKHKYERSKEELVAELTSLLLCSASDICSPTEDGVWTGVMQGEVNAENYILGWLHWMYKNPSDILYAMTQASHARDMILWWVDTLPEETDA